MTEQNPIPPGFARRGRSRVETSIADRTAADHKCAENILNGMLALDGLADFRLVAEITVERLVAQHKPIYPGETAERRLDRLADHLANVVAAMSEIIECRSAAKTDEGTLHKAEADARREPLPGVRHGIDWKQVEAAFDDRPGVRLPLAVLGQGEYSKEVRP